MPSSAGGGARWGRCCRPPGSTPAGPSAISCGSGAPPPASAGSRIDAMLDVTGLAGLAGRRAGRLSLGERQRLGLAGALLGDPGC